MKRVAAMLLAALVLSPTPGVGSQAGRRDPNDTPGRLDIKRIAHGHKSRKVLWRKVAMHSAWGRNALRGDDEIRFMFSTDREDRYDEVHAMVALKNGKLGAWIFPYVEGSDYAGVGPSTRIRFTRPDRRSIKIFFGRGWVDGEDRYAWSLASSYKDKQSRRCDRWCNDYAPGSSPDRLEHNL